MSLVLDGSAGVTFNNGTVQASAGSVLQVVQGTYGSITSTTGSTLITSNVTASITPKFSTSKILVLVNLASVGKISTTSNQAVKLALYRNASNVFAITDIAAFTNSALYNVFNVSTSYLDSPATTSSTSYTIYFCNPNASGLVFVNTSLNVQSDNNSTITLMEIAA
jgi:hypothetical protein